MSTLFNKLKKYKLTILGLVICFPLLYIINFYVENSALKLILSILVIIAEGWIIQYQIKLNKKVI